MPIQDRDTLKSYFETGDKPTQAQFGDLIDSMVLSADGSDIEVEVMAATNVLTNAAFRNIVPRKILYINNEPFNWSRSGISYNPSAGSFDFTSIRSEGATNALQVGDVIVIQTI